MSIAERVGAASAMFKPAGKRADVIDEAMELLDTAQACRRGAQDHSGAALRPSAAGGARHHAWVEAAGAAARRARGGRAERGEPHHSRCDRRIAEEHRRPDHRSRHGPGVPLRQEDHRAGARRDVRRRHTKGNRRQSGRARGLSRTGNGPMASARAQGRVGRLRRYRGAGGRQPRARPGRMHQRDRAERRRQDHAARDHHGPHHAAQGRGNARRPEPQRRADLSPRRCGPGLRTAGARDIPLAQRAGKSRDRRAAWILDEGPDFRAVPEAARNGWTTAAISCPAASSRCCRSRARC